MTIPPASERNFGYILVPDRYIGKKVRAYHNGNFIELFIEDPYPGGQIVRDLKELIDQRNHQKQTPRYYGANEIEK